MIPLFLSKIRKILIADVQLTQTLLLGTLLALGIGVFGLYLSPEKVATIFLTTVILDALLFRFERWEWRLPFAGLNAGFGIAFFLRTDSLMVYALAGCIAIGTKYILRIDGKHFLNPANIGVASSLLLFQGIAWTSPFQWGIFAQKSIYFWLMAGVVLAGLFVAWRVLHTRGIILYELVLAFIGTHMTLFFFVNASLEWMYILRYYTVGFFVFAFFMITDPQTNLHRSLHRIAYGAAIASISYVWIISGLNAAYAFLFSLTIMTFQLPWLRRWEDFDASPFKTRALWYILTIIFICILILSVYLYKGNSVNLWFTKMCPYITCS